MIFVSVGTFAHGFDALVSAVDDAARWLGRDGFAQIGHSHTVPRHLAFERFLSHPTLQAHLRAATVVVCHGGAGILGEAMRARRPIIAVPRQGATSAGHPANDQTAFLRRLAGQQPIRLCEDPSMLSEVLRDILDGGPAQVAYDLGSDVPGRIAAFLSRGVR